MRSANSRIVRFIHNVYPRKRCRAERGGMKPDALNTSQQRVYPVASMGSPSYTQGQPMHTVAQELGRRVLVVPSAGFSFVPPQTTTPNALCMLQTLVSPAPGEPPQVVQWPIRQTNGKYT